jgi:hypothetical protein
MTRWFGGIKANRMPDRLSVYICVFWRQSWESNMHLWIVVHERENRNARHETGTGNMFWMGTKIPD